jgi:ribosomal protein S18 acetylase RimI-like enzyme
MRSNATIETRRLNTCSFAAAVTIWNEGFQGYFVDMTLSLDAYLSRLQRDGLSPEMSLMAFCDGKPAGFLLNGIRTSAGRKIAWNGGTGVASEFRGRGVGKVLMRATMDIYREQGIELATLEAIADNQPAISLYQQFGYEVVDRLTFLTHEGELSEHAFQSDESESYKAAVVNPYAVGQLPFYDDLAPWQGHWQSLNRQNGTALIVSDARGIAVGYALYKDKSDEPRRILERALHQCVAAPDAAAAAVINCALRTLYAPFELAFKRTTYNFSKSNRAAQALLAAAGFRSLIEQVHMVWNRRG